MRHFVVHFFTLNHGFISEKLPCLCLSCLQLASSQQSLPPWPAALPSLPPSHITSVGSRASPFPAFAFGVSTVAHPLVGLYLAAVVAFPAFYFCKCRCPGKRLSRLRSVRAPGGRSCIFAVHLDDCTRAGAGLAGARSSASGLLMHKPFPFPYCSTSHSYSSFPYSTWRGCLPPCLHLPIAITYGKVFLLLGILPDAIPAPAAQPDTICVGMGTIGLEVGLHSVVAVVFCPRGIAWR